MHFVFATRGIKHEVDMFVKFMETQMFSRKKINLKTKKEEIELVQGQLRPIQLWEYIFPEEHKAHILTSLSIDENGKVGPFAAAFNAKLLQKAMGLEKVKYKKENTKRFIPHRNVAIYPIGIKKDNVRAWEQEGYELEML